MFEEAELRIEWPGGSLDKNVRVPVGFQTGDKTRYFEFPDRRGHLRRVTVGRGSCLWSLMDVSEAIASDYFWSESQAAWFALTGAVPNLPPVLARSDVSYYDDGQPIVGIVDLRILPFTSAETVLRAYAQARKSLLRKPPGPALQLRALKLFDFIEKRRTEDRSEIGWSRLMKEWDHRARPEWRYCDRRHFRRDYLRARELLLENCPGL